MAVRYEELPFVLVWNLAYLPKPRPVSLSVAESEHGAADGCTCCADLFFPMEESSLKRRNVSLHEEQWGRSRDWNDQTSRSFVLTVYL